MRSSINESKPPIMVIQELGVFIQKLPGYSIVLRVENGGRRGIPSSINIRHGLELVFLVTNVFPPFLGRNCSQIVGWGYVVHVRNILAI